MSKLLESIEQQELITKLKENGFGELVAVFLENEAGCYTKRNRLNKSGACRALGWKSKQLEDALKQMREILKSDFEELE